MPSRVAISMSAVSPVRTGAVSCPISTRAGCAMAVSVILKTLNEEARIGPAIESVLAALEGIGGEVIVADGGSRDRTLAVAANYPVRAVQLRPAVPPRCGIGPTLGFQYSREPFVCLIDGDMLLDPDFLAEALAYLEA